jgi:hypothetical protein
MSSDWDRNVESRLDEIEGDLRREKKSIDAILAYLGIELVYQDAIEWRYVARKVNKTKE